MRRCLLLVIVLLTAHFSWSQTPVILRVVSSEQHDTLGCNIVQEITRIAYNNIISGKVKLWDSPDKEVQITGVTLKEIEKASGTLFLDQPVIFIYEYWSGTGRTLRSSLSGITFSNKGKGGEEVSYGYLDFKDLQDIAFNAPVNSNANGGLNTALAYYLTSKRYSYHIIQYGTNVIDNISKSESLKMELTGGTGVFPNAVAALEEIPQKMVTWMMDVNNNTDSQKYLNARRFVKSVEDFLMENKEIFFNLGGDRILTHVNDKNRLNVTRIEVKEVWKKIDNEIQYDPVSVTVFVKDSSLTPVLYRDMLKMDIKVGLKSWVDFIKEKDFPYIITRINNQQVKRAESYLYQKALLSSEWSHVTEYVKYY